jgi:hypothetical protein
MANNLSNGRTDGEIIAAGIFMLLVFMLLGLGLWKLVELIGPVI